MPRVFCVTEPITYKDGVPVPAFDISPALKYGDINILTKHSQSMLTASTMVDYIRSRLQDFSDDDYILPVGDPVTIGCVTAIASEVNDGKFKMLKWDKRQRTYFVVDIDIFGDQDE